MTFHIPWDPCRRAVRGRRFPFFRLFNTPSDRGRRRFTTRRIPPPGRFICRADRPGGRWEARKGPAMGLGPPKGLGPSGDSGIEGSSVPIARRPDRSRRREIAGKWRRVALPPVPGTGFLEPAGAGGAGYEGIRLPEVEAHGRLTPFRDSAPDRKLGSKKFPAYRTPQERKCLERL